MQGRDTAEARGQVRMAAREFGDLLGLPQALPDMPVSPLVPAYADLRAQQAALGLRHAADGLFPPAPGRPAPTVRFLVLDGLRIPGRGGRPQHVDRALLARLGAELSRTGASSDTASRAGLLARYDAVLAHDPMGLRRIVLYELLRLLHEEPRGPRPEAAVDLGVDPAEASALALAARRAPRLDAARRAAAETLPDAWRERRIRHARSLAAQLPTPLHDQRVARLVARIDARARHVDDLLREADALARAGDPAAAERYLSAAQAAEDDPHALRGLVRTGRRGGLQAEPGRAGVRLVWRHDTAGTDTRHRTTGPDIRHDTTGPDIRNRKWRILRHTAGHAPVPAGEAEAPPPGDGTNSAAVLTFTDTAAPLGERVRYAVLPLDGGRIAGLPLVCADVLVAPEADDIALTDARARVDATWRTPPGARSVEVVRTGPRPGTTAAGVSAGPHGFRDDGLTPGTYTYRISCVYRTAAGRDVRSPGVRVRRTVHPWPDAVTALTVRPGDTPGTLAVTWTGGTEGEVRLVEWPGPPPPPGQDLPVGGPLPPRLPWPGCGTGGFRPPSGTTANVTALTVLGERAVTGASVRIHVPEAVGALTARRTAPGRVRLTFDWPRAADRVLVRWWQDGTAQERSIARSTYLREGLHLDVTASVARFQAEPLGVADVDVLLPPAPAEADIPADVAVAYTVERAGRFSGRRRVSIRAGILGGAGRALPDLPEFLLVARTAAEPLPRTPDDGTPVLRVSGRELSDGPVRRDVGAAVAAAGIRRPYTLRAFLLGPHARAVRLEDPPYNDLVVR
ncbi:hypothetical protein GCM10010359_45230 [Streptomyces morookaense]|nr:hypothetical protein GCM10010359_45230 [Streptomyces morookaense]